MGCLLIYRLFLVNFQLFIGHDARIAPLFKPRNSLKNSSKNLLEKILDKSLIPKK